MLTETLNLPNHSNLTRARLPSMIAMDQFLEVRKEGGHAVSGSDHEYARILAYWSTGPVRSTEHNPARPERCVILTVLSLVEKVPSQSAARLHEQV